MAHFRSSVSIDAPRALVWEVIADVRRHSDWMADAAEIRLTSVQATGVGTTFECETRVGPLRTLDRMAVTDWEEGRLMGVEHRGLVTGVGRFRLEDQSNGGTIFFWDEDLSFPWWLGGRSTAALARPLLALIWQRNLRRLAGMFKDGSAC
ncbi:MAG: SRPBCC family protein [Acidimicrobiaceae bacterium]|nr:SRPBCC family protein [Acidimicrobiaceae bacterium]